MHDAKRLTEEFRNKNAKNNSDNFRNACIARQNPVWVAWTYYSINSVNAKRKQRFSRSNKRLDGILPFPETLTVFASTPLFYGVVVFEKGTVDHDRYIKEVLPIALKYGNKVFGNDWTFQQDGATPHTHAKSQAWCAERFPSFIVKDWWPPNSPDLNPLDYCVWDEFVQAINWGRVTSKATLIVELKRSVRRIRDDVVYESYWSWTNRLYRLSQNNENYLR